MFDMRKLVLATVLAALPVAALAADPPHRRPDPNRTISREEWIDQSAKRFDAIDTNHDGKIDPAERKMAFADRRHHARMERKPADTNAPATPSK